MRHKLLKLFYVISWLPALLAKLILAILGIIAVPLALPFGSQERWEEKKHYFPKLFFIWDNKEEGYPAWWPKYIARQEPDSTGRKIVQFLREKMPRFWWFAVRNPVNGFRYIFKDREAKFEGWQSKEMEAHNLIEAGVTHASRWAYSGVFAGYRSIKLNGDGTYNEFWIGWKVGSDVEGMGLTLQNRKDVKIGQ
jgi:hypothetical protein